MLQPPYSFPDLCAASAREMLSMQSQIQTLEDAVFDILDRGQALSSADRKSLQDFDLVIQTLGGMARFYTDLQLQSEKTGTSCIAEASEDITLEKLKVRLRSPRTEAST
jgi:hypothetical protein